MIEEYGGKNESLNDICSNTSNKRVVVPKL